MSVTAATIADRPGAGNGSAGPAASLTGTRELVRLSFRRDRVLLVIWIYALTAIAGSGGYSLKFVYKTTADRLSLAASVAHDPALSFLYGQLHGSSLGELVSWRYLAYAALGAGLMSIFVVIRHTRADEETGRLELVGATVVGRHAPLAVALALVATANLVLLLLVFAGLAVSGLPVTGAIAFAVAMVGASLVFAAVAAIAAQIGGTARGARGLSIAVLAVAFLLQATGNSGTRHGLSWLTWLSPIGWAENVRPFATERWWVLGLPVAASAVGVAVAYGLAARRDQGAGLIQPRPGRPAAGRLLTGPAGLAWRLQGLSLAGWFVGFLACGVAVGVVTNGVGQLIGASGEIAKAIKQLGGQVALANAYVAAVMGLFGLVAGAYAIAVVLRLRAEETDGRAEPILAGPVSRLRWSGTHLLVAAAGTAALLLAAGLGAGVGYGVASSDAGTQVPRLIGAGLVQLPAAAALASVAVAAVGLVPRWSAAVGWTALAICGFISIFGPTLQLGQPLLDVSPFTHVPKLPGAALSATPLVWLSLAALALTGAGLIGLRHRDIG